jgi:transcriptional regulator with XRE-family HTH domain
MTKRCVELEKLGKAIREFRAARSLGEAAVAKKAGMTPVRLTAIEAGEAEANVRELTKLARALGLTTQALVAKAGL